METNILKAIHNHVVVTAGAELLWFPMETNILKAIHNDDASTIDLIGAVISNGN